MSDTKPYRIAIVGTGPSGMYSLAHLIEERNLNVEVDLYERLPTPWGLVRSGVAPDHPEKKWVVDRQFDYFFKRPEVRFFGNTEVGTHVSVEELSDWYDGVIYAVGASSDTKMNVPGEDLPGCWAAREFVSWYNGHPDYRDFGFDLSHERAVIIGNGNVALDVARILTLPESELRKTDIADHTIEAVGNGNLKEVVILGRRGHMQGAFNNPELEELEHIEGVEVLIEGSELPPEDEPVDENAEWEAKRKLATLQRLKKRKMPEAEKRIILHFLASPLEVLGDGKVEKLRVVRNELIDGRAVATDDITEIDTGLVLRAIGYRGYPFPGLPFDDSRGVIANDGIGRITDGDTPVPGAYVTGWIKRGPRGIIGSNKRCSRDTVRCWLEDVEAGKLTTASKTGEEVYAIIKERQPELVERPEWLKIDHSERVAGRQQDRPRVKYTVVDDMLKIAHGD